MEPLSQAFWEAQQTYLQTIFPPIFIGVAVFLPLFVLLFVFGFGRRSFLWRRGKPEDRSDQWILRLKTALNVAFVHFRTLRPKEVYPGVMHLLIFWGTVFLFLGKFVRLFGYVTGITTPPQAVYLGASWVAEFGAVLILAGGAMAVYRRYIVKPTRLDTKREDSLVFAWVGLIILTGFMVKGYRIAISDVPPTDWLLWSPVGYLFSKVFPTFMLAAKNEILVWHRVLFHTVPAMVLLGYIWVNRSRLQHIVLSPLNVYFRNLKAKGALSPIDLEKTETFGVPKIEDFTWKQLLDLDACTRCGRCQDNCPAHLSSKPLTPKKVVQDLKGHLEKTYPIPYSKTPVEPRPDMVTEVITEDVVWNCTTCWACQEACPVYIEPMVKVMDMRRNLVLDKAKIPETAEGALRSIEARGHPWRGTTLSRTDWAEGLNIKPLSEKQDVDILFWVGCTEALEERSSKVAQAIARLFQQAGVNFGILGTEETCCGDPARRLGNEYLYQMQVQANLEVFKNYGIKKIVTGCPHCYNSLKYEYPQFGGQFEVIHHTQFILGLINEGKLKNFRGNDKLITYHDSCYLGRYNDIYQPPRQLLGQLPDVRLAEMERNLSRGFCCGAGGGHLWLEEQRVGQRINVMRTEQAMAVKAEIIATACPYCLQMFTDGIKSKQVEETLKVMDVAELLAEASTNQPHAT